MWGQTGMKIAPPSRMEVLKGSFETPQALSRPIITYVNGDVSWLVSFPRPASAKSTNGKIYYHVVVDPWFGLPSVFMNPLVLEMRLGRDPALSSRAELDAAIVEIELAAGNSLVPTDSDPAVDAIFIMGLAEHCHKESLLQFSISTPVFAVPGSASNITSWSHFDTVVTLAPCDPSKTPWEEGHPGSPLPAWLTIFSPAVKNFNNFGLVLITSANALETEMILMAPHGISSDEPFIKGLLATTVKMLALVAPLKNSYSFGIKTVLGVDEALILTQAAGTRYYVRNGDFVSLKYKGIIGWSVRDEPHDLQWGIDQVGKKPGAEKIIEPPIMVEVSNGGSYVLM
ncbi:uncharacterized protein LY89DRAFT_506051 [Mollisia scopiformis]|uniref:Uncharacterized protein n=1 Tax=Mollisia scopiformis TaxID=149040 RepID=A0A194XF70_MOLSC|nr:uncharacterized protein LY89DRAFT_506051 [Mollisia scopiformis]KUJ18840.1 hypothetical protein LY89DRAFT_506051 [Mollisia scopiformis]